MVPVDTLQTEMRLLVLPPTARDATLSQTVLAQAGIACKVCDDLASLCRELRAGAGAVLLNEEALVGARAEELVATLTAQPPWSDIPVLLLTRGGGDSPVASLAAANLGNATLLERPVRVATLLSAVRSALRGRARQYQTRELLAHRARAEQALREADQRKDEFLAMLAHELRGPLAPLTNALHLLRLRGNDPAFVEQVRHLAERQVNQLARLVGDLLDVSRITRGKLTLNKERVDAHAIVADAVEMARPLLEARNHRITVLLPPQPLALHADPARLVQILANLLSNAAKYTEPGGQVWVSAERSDGEVLLRVRDTGVGLSADLLSRVFDLFVQATPGSQGGLGIGLALVRGLAELHGGTVKAYSEGPGKGSEFVVRLPCPHEPAAKVPVPPRAMLATPSRRVLIVDDDVDGATSLAAVLRLCGHQVEVAHDGLAALEAARRFRPEAVLLDITLPGGLDGYEVARRLRAEVGLREGLIVALTGWGQDEDRKRAHVAGFDQFCVKPVDPQALAELVARPLAQPPDQQAAS